MSGLESVLQYRAYLTIARSSGLWSGWTMATTATRGNSLRDLLAAHRGRAAAGEMKKVKSISQPRRQRRAVADIVRAQREQQASLAPRGSAHCRCNLLQQMHYWSHLSLTWALLSSRSSLSTYQAWLGRGNARPPNHPGGHLPRRRRRQSSAVNSCRRHPHTPAPQTSRRVHL